uniref:Cysteine-serine-rich nuclear protein 1a n=1 Tax=Oryzias latipes TaxID=8090 RepID=A0A3P9ITJ4_ORYLA
MKGLNKRKFAEVERNPSHSPASSSPFSNSSPGESDGEGRDFTPPSVPIQSILKRPKHQKEQRSVCFGSVTVFSFHRCQGFTSVPSRGGATLGMAQKHSTLRKYTMAEHEQEQQHRSRERHRQKLRKERIEQIKHKLIMSGAVDQHEARRLAMDQVQDEDLNIRVSDHELEDGGFLPLFSSRQRKALLQAAGVKFIDREEKRQLHALRLSREACGCDCQGFCEPETCACSLAGIKCQVDRFNFPCGCSKDNCGNTQGRVEFDARRVRTHFLHTVMKLELERRLQEESVNPEDHAGLPEELHEYENQDKEVPEQSSPDKRCPFGFTLEEDGLPLTMPATPSYHFIPEQENSCSSDMTESSCLSSDSDAGFCSRSQSPPDVNTGTISSLDCENEKDSSCSHLRHVREQRKQWGGSSAPQTTAADNTGPPRSFTVTDKFSRNSATGYLDENANQSRDFIEDLEVIPNTLSSSLDYSFSSYMDLSLSSDSDLEFFGSDYPSGPSQSSVKDYRQTCSFQHLQHQLCSFVGLPQNDSNTQLLESLLS